MDFKELYNFLEQLQKHNDKEWMDDNRKWYHQLRDDFIGWLNQLDARLAQVDSEYTHTDARKAMNRINNNLMFHPDKPVYKDHFAAGLDQVSKQGDFYIHIGLGENMLAGGYWKPNTKTLNSLRHAIDYNGEDFIAILEKDSFKKKFGDLVDDGDSLTQAPKGFSKEHRYIELLRKKTFAVAHSLTRKEVLSNSFDDRVIEVYKEMLPFRRYLNQAVTV